MNTEERICTDGVWVGAIRPGWGSRISDHRSPPPPPTAHHTGRTCRGVRNLSAGAILRGGGERPGGLDSPARGHAGLPRPSGARMLFITPGSTRRAPLRGAQKLRVQSSELRVRLSLPNSLLCVFALPWRLGGLLLGGEHGDRLRPQMYTEEWMCTDGLRVGEHHRPTSTHPGGAEELPSRNNSEELEAAGWGNRDSTEATDVHGACVWDLVLGASAQRWGRRRRVRSDP
jgi:hypothetical protein